MTLEEIFNKCINYDKIINYNYDEFDTVTDDVIKSYQNIVLLYNKNDYNYKLIDKIVMEYISNRDFNKYAKEYYNMYENKYFDDINQKLIEIYRKYLQTKKEKTKWI